MVTLVDAPRGLDLPVASAALIDSDDVRLGLAVGAGLGRRVLPARRRRRRRGRLAGPAGEPARARGDLRQGTLRRRGGPRRRRGDGGRGRRTAGPLGAPLPSGRPRLRTSRRPRRPAATTRAPTCSASPSRSPTAPTAWSASRTRSRTCWPTPPPTTRPTSCGGCRSSAAQARPSTWRGSASGASSTRCGPAPTSSASTNGPNWGCGRAGAIGIHQPGPGSAPRPGFAGTIWVQEGSRPLADDADDVLRGAAVLAARIMSRLAATPSTHAVRVQELLGLRDGQGDDTQVARAGTRARHRRRRARRGRRLRLRGRRRRRGWPTCWR